MRNNSCRKLGYMLLTLAVVVLLAAIIPVWLVICVIVASLACALVMLTR